MLRQYVARNFPTALRPLPRDRVTCQHRQFVVLLDRQPAGARDRFPVSQQAAIAVGHEQAAAQRSSDIEGLPAQPSLKADIDHKKLFPAVTNPAAPGAIAGAPVSGAASADPSRPLADAVPAMTGRCRKAPEGRMKPALPIIAVHTGNRLNRESKITKKGGAFHARQ
jgi:hypothetical protein